MEVSTELPEASHPSHPTSLYERQASILRQIEQVRSTVLSQSSSKILHLQQQHNNLIDEQTPLEPSPRPLRDPLEVLPQELWVIIVTEAIEKDFPIDSLLILAFVSVRWHCALLFHHSLWSTIVLDQERADYLAKARMCITLSANCELHFKILVPLDVWHTISALILPHSKRICSLRFNSRDALKILSTFTELPNLRDIQFPRSVALYERDFIGRKFDRMPLLSTVTGANLSNTPSWRNYIVKDSVVTKYSVSKLMEEWKLLPNLQSLNIVEFGRDSSQQPITLDSSLKPVTNFSYRGGAFQRTLRFIGSNLIDLGLSISLDGAFQDLLLTLEPFQRLYRLSITISGHPHMTLPHRVNVPSRCIPVKILRLSLGFPEPFDSDVVWKATGPFFQALISAMPLVEDFALQNAVFTEQLRSYIEVLHGLRVLSMEGCYIQPGVLAAPLNLKQLDLLNWCEAPSTAFLHNFSAQVLRTLRVGADYNSPRQNDEYSGLEEYGGDPDPPSDTGEHDIGPEDYYSGPEEYEGDLDPPSDKEEYDIDPEEYYSPEEYEGDPDPPNDTGEYDIGPEDYYSGPEEYGDDTYEEYSFILPNHKIPTDAFPNLTSLTCLIRSPVNWSLGSLPMLKELGLQPSPDNSLALAWASDILEGILMRPKELPALEKIILRGDFLEWDILLLMLERRNIPSRRGISLIKTLVVDWELPYKLLLPLSMLLQGKFPLVALHSFSIETIGERLWNKYLTGCQRCCHAFRACEAVVPMGGSTGAENEANQMLNWLYPLPSEMLDADPPLSPELARWLSGKRRRRANFVSELNEFAPEFHRQGNCGRIIGPVTITKHCLEGMKFTAKQGTKPSESEVEDSE